MKNQKLGFQIQVSGRHRVLSRDLVRGQGATGGQPPGAMPCMLCKGFSTEDDQLHYACISNGGGQPMAALHAHGLEPTGRMNCGTNRRKHQQATRDTKYNLGGSSAELGSHAAGTAAGASGNEHAASHVNVCGLCAGVAQAQLPRFVTCRLGPYPGLQEGSRLHF